MNQLYSSYQQKAEIYAQFRWDYAPEAIEQICQQCGLRTGDRVADVGSGTGMLSRWFVMKGMQVYGVEPEAEMRATAEDLLQEYSNFHSVAATAEATTLPDASVDLIAVGRALHWFSSEAARREFCRIVKPGGWLAVLAVRNLDTALHTATRALKVQSNGFRLDQSKESRHGVDLPFYFGHDDFLELSFTGVEQETWLQFWGRLRTLSGAPDHHSAYFATFEKEAYLLFQQFAGGDHLQIPTSTDVWVGRLC